MSRDTTRRAVIVITDGQRRDMLGRGATPTFERLASRGTVFSAHRSAFPSVTRCCSATLATGCRPARHGLHGNQMALPNGDGFSVHDVGLPDFFPTIRAAYGRVLKRPTLAQRLADAGGAVIVSNVSPGAAYAHDPDGHGEVYHRAGSYGPGRVPLYGGDLVGEPTVEGDRAITEAFCTSVLPRRPALAVLWLCFPDKAMHAVPLASPAHMAAVSAADACLSRVVETVERQRGEGDDILLLAGSDHGHRTVTGAVAAESLIAEAGLKDEPHSGEVVVAPQGTSGLVYVAERARTRIDAIAALLASQPWCGPVFAGERLAEVGLAPQDGLAIAFSAAAGEAPSADAPGAGVAIQRFSDTTPLLGFGQHGGLEAHEQMPILIADGGGFTPSLVESATDLTDIAPTVLAHLAQPVEGMDGRPLQRFGALAPAP